MPEEKKRPMGPRIVFIQILLVGCLCLLGARSFEVQIFQARDLTQKAENNYSRHLTIQGERGLILDRNFNKLGASIDALTVTADPSQIEAPEKTAKALAGILKIDRAPLAKRLATDRRFAVVARDISPDQAAQIRELKIRGIYFKNDSKRFYPNRNLAAQVIGFTGEDDAGLEGLEFKYNAVLTGAKAKIKITKDGTGRILDIDKQKKAELKGNSLVLTIDKKIQFLSERALESTVKEHKAHSGMALVMRPDTGELLAIAHYPQFNPNNYQDFSQEVFRNRAVTDAFEPGSAMKVFTAAAALETGFTPKSIFYCENGEYRIGRYTIHDTHAHEWLSINKIIKFSSNIGAAKICETIGKETLYQYLVGFGFGTRTLLGCPGESPGSLLPPGQWSDVDAGAISFGQGLSVSAVQLISGISAIANHGELMKPMLIKKIISNTGKDIQVFSPERLRKVVSETTAAQVRRMLAHAVEEDGTGTKAAIEGYSVCGKTGTAQKARKDRRGYEKNKYISVFAGFAPRDNPRLAALVIVDEPKEDYYGGDVAAPAFREIMAQSFNYLNIPPEKEMVAALAKGDRM